MTALLIDTSGSEGYLAITCEGKVIQTLILSPGRVLSKLLFPSIVSLLKQKLDFITAGIGPGTFTGIRVGVIAAKSLAFGWHLPFLSFSSSLLPDLSQIAKLSYQSFLIKDFSSQIELVYI